MANDPQVIEQTESATGQTSSELAQDTSNEPQRKSLTVNVYDMMMAVSLLCITIACILITVNIWTNFKGLALPWRTETGAVQTSAD